jgi:hypothetical protein
MKNLPASQGVQWLNETFAFLRSDARHFFGMSALFLVLLLALTVPFEIPMFAATVAKQAPTDAVMVSLMLMQALLALATPILMAGWYHAFREHSAGRPVSPTQLFQAFRVPGVIARLLCLSLVSLAAPALTAVLVKLLMGANYYTLLADGGVTLKAMGLGATLEFYLLSFVIGMSSWAFLLFSIPRVFLDGIPPLTALGESFRAALGNFLPLLVFFLALIAIAMVFCLLMGVAMALLIVLSLLLGKIGAALGVLLGLVFFLAMIFAMIYLLPAAYYPNFLMWRDVFGDAAAPIPPADSISV